MMHCKIELIRRTQLAEDIFELAFRPPGAFDFLAGQYIRFRYEGMERDYTLVSAPGESRLCICIQKVMPPNFSAHLAACPMGEAFEISGPHGFFMRQPSPHTDVFVGTGTGVAPFAAYARAGASGFMLLQGAATPDRLIYRDLFRKAARTFVPCLSQIAEGAGKEAFRGRGTDYLETQLPGGTYQFYLCGRRQMILDAMDIIDHRFPGSRVFTEWFT